MDLNKENINTYKNKSTIKHYKGHTKIEEIERKLIKKYFESPVLDLGCGVGRTTKYLFDEGFKVIGVDIIKDMIEEAKIIYPKINFEVGDACNLKFKDNSFKTVFFSFNGLDYIYPKKKRIQALKEVERVLMSGGTFVFSSHNSLALLFRSRPLFLLRNLKKKYLFSDYKMESHPFGDLYTYYAPPKKQIKLIEDNTRLKFLSQYRNGIKDLHPHYVFKKS